MTSDQAVHDQGDPRADIAERPMGAFQIAVIAALFCLNALDGFDVLAIAFAAPGITRQWSVSPQALGFVISIGLFANAFGSLLIAPFADRAGRRPLMFVSLAAMTAGMSLCAVAPGIGLLPAGRLITGVGVGALVPCISALASEYCNRRYRDFGVIVTAIGFPVGGLVGGQASAWLLQHFDWRSVFGAGALATGVLLLAPLWVVPESIEYLLARRPANALQRVNAIVRRLGHPEVRRLPAAGDPTDSRSISDILARPALLVIALTVTLAYALHGATLYYSLNWIPKIVVDLALSQSDAARVAAWCSGGGIVGASIAAWLATRLPIRALTIGALAGTAAALCMFARAPGVLSSLLFAAVLLGAFLYGAQVSLYALMTRSFPVSIRATGVGFVTGVGRLGGIASPLLSGYLLGMGLPYRRVSSFMALGSLLAAVLLLASLRPARSVPPVPES